MTTPSVREGVTNDKDHSPRAAAAKAEFWERRPIPARSRTMSTILRAQMVRQHAPKLIQKISFIPI
jgi:hypothetical protein